MRRSANLPIPILAAILGFAISVLVGTVRWLPPERILGRSLLAAALVCSVGLVSVRCLEWLAIQAKQQRNQKHVKPGQTSTGPEQTTTSTLTQPARASAGPDEGGR